MERLLGVSPTDLCISSVVEMDLLFGIEMKPQFSYLGEMRNLLQRLPVVGFDSDCALQAARLRAALQRTGRPIGPYDALIAATALAKNLTLVTRNTREFSRLPGLRVQDWEAASAA